MKFLKSALAALACASVVGCASTAYECPLSGSEAAKCSSTEDAYKASRRLPKDTSGMTSAFDNKRPAAAQAQDAKPYVGAQASDYPGPSVEGMPVFQQPRVYRPWLAPYVDAEGNLRSGEYGYFSTPGRWNYGTLRTPGNASGLQGPARPDNLGFNPVIKPEKAGAPPKPAEARTSANAPEPRAQEAKVGDITQPYQRITD